MVGTSLSVSSANTSPFTASLGEVDGDGSANLSRNPHGDLDGGMRQEHAFIDTLGMHCT